jgi:CrcB protein
MWWIVALGSGLGGVLRYLIGGAIQRVAGPSFPMGTLVVNVTGSLAIGFLMRYALDSAAISAELRTFLAIGVCGGYTTFSTFSYETVRLLQDGDYFKAAGYVALSVALSVIATIAGMGLAGELWRWRRLS